MMVPLASAYGQEITGGWVCIALTKLVVLDLVVLDGLYLVLDDSPITVFSQPCTGLVY